MGIFVSFAVLASSDCVIQRRAQTVGAFAETVFDGVNICTVIGTIISDVERDDLHSCRRQIFDAPVSKVG